MRAPKEAVMKVVFFLLIWPAGVLHVRKMHVGPIEKVLTSVCDRSLIGSPLFARSVLSPFLGIAMS